jgi:hypothetical protein
LISDVGLLENLLPVAPAGSPDGAIAVAAPANMSGAVPPHGGWVGTMAVEQAEGHAPQHGK